MSGLSGDLLSLLAAYAPAGTTPFQLASSGDRARDRAKQIARAHSGNDRIVDLIDLDSFEREATSGSDIAAVVAEPAMRRAAGTTAVPPGELRRVREICTQRSILLIDDETFAGGGRTGFLWGITRDGVSADLAVAGETLTPDGAPIGVVFAVPEIAAAAKRDEDDSPSEEAIRAAIGYVTMLHDGNFLGEVRRKAANLTDMLETLQGHPDIRQIHQRGLLVSINTANDKDPIVLAPPLGITDEDLGLMVQAVAARLKG